MILTFDDGPSAAGTPALLDLLARHGLRATFFVLGSAAAQHPAIVRRIVADGHAVGNHSWDHPMLPALPEAVRRRQLARTSALIEQITGSAPDLFRPPYGASSAALEQQAAELGLSTQLWDVDTEDWSEPGAEAICAALLSARAEDVVLMHDGRRAGRQTIEGLGLALSALRQGRA
ncbi:MAG: polysaccharide deacetylase family protein [Solirubrobacteraceae bacterium]